MHRLDGHINDIEPRIKAIYENASKQEEPSLQVSLCSYGWILLDSWVAWRTLRFILKDAKIDERVQNKWFQTPSSYTASQIKAIWGFSDEVESYVQERTGKKLKELFDRTIQAKRNASAHFTKNSEVTGQDALLIKQIYETLSMLFLLYESHHFFESLRKILEKNGFSDYRIEFSDSETYSLLEMKTAIKSFCNNKEYKITCKDSSGEKYLLVITNEGCDAGKEDSEEFRPVFNDSHDTYDLLGNKGYYRDVDLFADTLLKCWGL